MKPTIEPGVTYTVDDVLPEREAEPVEQGIRVTPRYRSPDGAATLYHADCRAVLADLAPNSIDAIVTDPPAGIAFMQRAWDHDKGGRDQWVAWLAAIMREALRVAKPGAHMLCWALPRTSHWTATAIEDAGWEIRDIITHHFGSGFPKSLSISAALDKAAGVEREVIAPNRWLGRDPRGKKPHTSVFTDDNWEGTPDTERGITAPATDAAKQWAGYGTAIKPASEHWILARKPFKGNVAANVLTHGTGGLNIDTARIGNETVTWGSKPRAERNGFIKGFVGGTETTHHDHGRWPANLVLSHSEQCVERGVRRVKGSHGTAGGNVDHAAFGGGMKNRGNAFGYAAADGYEEVSAWECVDGCPVRELDRQSGETTSTGGVGPTTQSIGGRDAYSGGDNRGFFNYSDTGHASRFFHTFPAATPDPGFIYQAKPSRAERDLGCEHLPAYTGAELTDRTEGSAGLDSPRAGAGRTSGGPCLRLRENLSDSERAYVEAELRKAGVAVD